jgi:hypothetical protein
LTYIREDFPIGIAILKKWQIICLLSAMRYQLASAGLSILLSDNQSLRHVLFGNMIIIGLNAKI